MMKSIPIALLLLAAACTQTETTTTRPMDEVPAQRTLANGEREYRFANGCAVVLEPAQAVVRAEIGPCELYHRDIALLYASGD
jgi:hypothetical protein